MAICVALAENNRSLAQKILDFIKEFIDAISSIFADIKEEADFFEMLGIEKEVVDMMADIIKSSVASKEKISSSEKTKTTKKGKEETKYSISAELDKRLRSVLDNTFPKEKSEVYIGTSSRFLTNIIGAKQLRILMAPNKAYAAMVSEERAKAENRYDKRLNYHNLGKDKLIQALESSENPIAAVVSKDESGNKKRVDRILLITDVLDDHGNNIVVVEQIDSRGTIDNRQIDANRVITVFGKEYINGVVKDAIASDTILHYDKNKISTITLNQERQTLNRKSSTYFSNNINNFWANVNWEKQKDGKVKKYSLSDKKYLEAVKSRDMQTAQEMVNEAARAAGYDRLVYHQTSNDFTVFDTQRATHSQGEYLLPFGVFTKKTDQRIDIPGTKQMKLFAKADNALRLNSSDEIKNIMPKEYVNTLEEKAKIIGEIDRRLEIAEDELLEAESAYLDKNQKEYEKYLALSPEELVEHKIESLPEQKVYDDILSELSKAENEMNTEARDSVGNWLKANGYDAVEVEIDQGGRKSQVTDALVIINNARVKSADPVVYDDSGKVIPLSERFNPESEDIRYSIRHIKSKTKDYGVGVVLDTELFDGKSPREWNRILRKFVYENLAGTTVTVYNDGVPEQIYLAKKNDRVKKDGANNSRKVIEKLVRDKTGDNIGTLAVVHIDELAEASTFRDVTDEHTHQWLDENGWINRTVYLMDIKGDIFEATLNIADGRDRKILYDISKIKKVDVAEVASFKGSSQNHDFYNNIITDEKEKSNKKFSLKDSEGNKLSKQQAEFFKDSKVRKNGKLLPVYHGTPAENITIFDPEKSDDSISLFFTDNEELASTFGKEKYKLYLNLKNPLTIDGNGSEWHRIRGKNKNTFKREFQDFRINTDYDKYEGEEIFTFSFTGEIEKGSPVSAEYLDEEGMASFLVEDLGMEENVVEELIGQAKIEAKNVAAERNADDGSGTIVKNNYEYNSTFGTTREWALYAKENNYDGVIFTNIYDGTLEVKGNVYVAFNPNQVKSIENKTPTNDSDIRYSLKKKLTETERESVSYNVLVNKPDMSITRIETLDNFSRKKIVAKARTNVENYGEKGIDGTYNVYVEDIDRNIIIGKNSLIHGLHRDYRDTAMVTGHIAEYLRNAIIINYLEPKHKMATNTYLLLGYGETESGEQYPAYFVVDTLITGQEVLREFDRLYSVSGKKIGDSAQGSRGFHTLLSPKIRIAELLSKVNKIYSDILSDDVLKHFSVSRKSSELGKSVKFSLSSPVEETKDLIAVHNLNEEALIKALELGGFPMPSIAVTKARIGHDNFGEISVLFDKSTIDPKTSRYNKVYSSDAWTPTYPTIEHKINQKKAEEIIEKVNRLIETSSFKDHNVGRASLASIESYLLSGRSEKDIVNILGKDLTYKAAFLADIGVDIPVVYREKFFDKIQKRPNNYIVQLSDELSDDDIADMGKKDLDTARAFELKSKIAKIFSKKYEEKMQEEAPSLIISERYKPEQIDLTAMLSAITAYRNLGSEDVEREIDATVAYNRIAKEVSDRNLEFTLWLRDLFDGIVEKSGRRKREKAC